MLEDLGVLGRGEVAVVLAGLDVGQDDAVDQLLEAGLAGVGADGAAEVLGGDDRGGVDRPEVGELDAALLEDRLAGLPVLLDDVAALPGHLVVGVHAGRGVDALDRARPCLLALRAPARAPAVSVMSLASLTVVLLLVECLAAALTVPPSPRCVLAGAVVLVVLGGAGLALRAAGRRRGCGLRLDAGRLALGAQQRDRGLEVLEGVERLVDAGEPQVGDLVELAQRPEDRPGRPRGRRSRRCPAARMLSSTRWASRARSSSVTGRPWQALRTPTSTLARLNGSVAPERLTTSRLAVSTVVNRRPHSGHWRRRRIAVPSSVVRRVDDPGVGVPAERAVHGRALLSCPLPGRMPRARLRRSSPPGCGRTCARSWGHPVDDPWITGRTWGLHVDDLQTCNY